LIEGLAAEEAVRAHGRSVKACACFGRKTAKRRWSSVAIDVSPSRSAVAMTEASTVPKRKIGVPLD
jgi:hypothetical protein